MLILYTASLNSTEVIKEDVKDQSFMMKDFIFHFVHVTV